MARPPSPARTLNLKNPEVYRLASELAAATGESMTEAVRLSLQERLDRVRTSDEADRERRLRRITELAATLRSLAPPGYFAQDFGELMYDENGLPVW
jgi:antitoxin VapB